MTKINFDLEAFRDRVLSDPLVYDAWDKKYRYKLPDGSSPEDTVSDTRARVVRAVYAQDSDPTAVVEALELVENGYLVPAGRINAGAGLDRAVTLTNCFVNETVQDSMVGIQQVITRAALTMQQGGGIGTDWSTVRPAGALVKRTGSVSSGVIPFMDQMSAMCKTVVSAGTRRGAMMGTLRCDHPDLWNEEQFETTTTFSGTEILKNPSFISAKRQKDRLDQFNISVLVTDEFMQAVKDGTDWDLGFHVPRADGKHVAVYDKLLTHVTIERGADGSVVVIRSPETAAPWYVYRRLPARKIWEDIMRSTYVYAEPGVIFIDRVNQKNNLNYCETINCTNPCLTGDTLIAVAGRGPVAIRQLAEEGADVPVFALDKQTREITVRIGRNPRLTQKNAALVEVELDDGAMMRLTPQHRFMLRDGREIPAVDLQPGDSLVRTDVIYLRSKSVNETVVNGRLEQHLIAEGKYGKKFIWGRGHGKYHAHHVNGDHTDNSWNNIEVMTHGEHSSLHRSGDNNPMRKWWSTLTEDGKNRYRLNMADATSGTKNGMWGRNHGELTREIIGEKTRSNFKDAGFRQRHSDGVRSSMTAEARALISVAANSRYHTFDKTCEECGKNFVVRSKDLTTGAGKRKVCGRPCASKVAARAAAKATTGVPRSKEIIDGLESRVFTDKHRQALRDASVRRYARHGDEATGQPFNHKVVSVKHVETVEDVYNLTVDEHHNYMVVTSALKNGFSCVGVLNCGEQPLPEDGTCCLGSLNLAFMVKTPFTRTSEIDWPLLRKTAIAGVRFLDNVLTVTRWPLPEQGAESDRKRRVGLGVTGFADMLAQLGVRYGSEKSVHIADDLARELKIASYTASAELAGERGSFLNFSGQILNAPNLLSLPNHVRDLIKKYGLRNGVLNTVAPNGTISLYIGNVSSGIEPIFSTTKYRRKVRQADGSLQEYEVVDYAQRLYEEMYPGSPLPSYFVGAHDVTPEEHLEVQAAWQRHIDASISKTINCSVDTSFENFETIYTRAYELGCKGVTTYRPDPIAGRGSVMSEISETSSEPAANQVASAALRERPRVVHGATYKLKWPQNGENIYVTVNHAGREPLEVFIKHADSRLTEWTDALSRMITGVLRRGGDFRFLVDQLEQVGSANGGAFLDGKFRLSQVGAIAGVLEQEFKRLREETETIAGPVTTDGELQVTVAPRFDDPEGDICPSCNSRTFVREEGCHRCLTCGHEACG